MVKAIKLIVDIEQDKLGINVRGEFHVTDMLFSDMDGTIDSAQMIKDVKQCIKSLKGFNMLTIRMTEDERYVPYPHEVHSVRFVNHFGEIKMSYVNGSQYSIWEVVTDKSIYQNIRIFVDNANYMHKLSRQVQQA
jgi:hypothetical protein